jgi:hypothetical protein
VKSQHQKTSTLKSSSRFDAHSTRPTRTTHSTREKRLFAQRGQQHAFVLAKLRPPQGRRTRRPDSVQALLQQALRVLKYFDDVSLGVDHHHFLTLTEVS